MAFKTGKDLDELGIPRIPEKHIQNSSGVYKQIQVAKGTIVNLQMAEEASFVGLELVSSTVSKPYAHSTLRSLCSPLACSTSGARVTTEKSREKINQEGKDNIHISCGAF